MVNFPHPSPRSRQRQSSNNSINSNNLYSTNRNKIYRNNKNPPSLSPYSNSSIRRSLRLHYRRLSSSVSSQPTRKLAILIFALCTVTSISVVFRYGNARIDHLYNYYDAYSNTISSNNDNYNDKYNNNNDSNNNNYGNFVIDNEIDNNDPKRLRALQNAKSLTKDWIKLERQDEVELDGLIKTFRSQLQEVEQYELEEKRKIEAEKEELEAESAYYLYYQDDNDSTSTVIGLPSQNQSSDPMIFKRFVGSLRKTGFGGNIIIGVEETVGDGLVDYLKAMSVIVKYLIPVECTFEFAKKNQKCYHPYSHIKREWSYFPLARDWLTSCEVCVGSVAIASVRDTVFQLNPFGKGMPIISRLHLYELHPSVVAAQTSAGVLLKACENIDLDKININLQFSPEMTQIDPLRMKILSAGTAVGTRDDAIDYLGSVHSVMREWMQRSQCHFEHSTSDDGMAIVNYLRLKHKLPYRTRIIPHRTGIVNNVGYEGRNAYEAHLHFWEFKGLTSEEASKMEYEGAEGEGWIDTEYLMTDSDGQFIDVFFQKSAIIYEYNAFGTPFTNWFDKRMGFVSDTAASSTNEGDGGDNNGDPAITTGIDTGSIDSNSNNNNESKKNITDTTDLDKGVGIDDDVDPNEEDDDDDGDNGDNDDYYIKKNSDEDEKLSNTTSTSTSPLNNRLVDNATDNSTKTDVEVKKEDQQPMYYRDPKKENNETETGNSNGTIENEEDGGGGEKSTQVVPVEEIKAKDEEEDEEKINEERLAVKKGTTAQEGIIV